MSLFIKHLQKPQAEVRSVFIELRAATWSIQVLSESIYVYSELFLVH